MSYHVNEKGNPGACHAKKGKCPFGGQENHYETTEQAREAYERSQDIYSKLMNHEPRANWKKLNAKEESGIYTHYRRVLRSIRSTPTKKTAAETKQASLLASAQKYGMPISQVKSIVQTKQAEEKIPSVHEDSQRAKIVAFDSKALTLESQSPRNDAGEMICTCGSTEEVRVRVNPFDAEIYETRNPLLSCRECYLTIKEDI